jgi:hypothetical protein
MHWILHVSSIDWLYWPVLVLLWVIYGKICDNYVSSITLDGWYPTLVNGYQSTGGGYGTQFVGNWVWIGRLMNKSWDFFTKNVVRVSPLHHSE